MFIPVRSRSPVTRLPVPMAVPVDTTAATPLGTRLASSAARLLDRTRTETARRIVLWTLVTMAIGILALAYLLQTSQVASLANERATLERETAQIRDADARLAAQAASFQTLSHADSAARDQGLRTSLSANVSYVSLPNVTDASPTPAPAPAAPPGILTRIQRALAGRASVDNHGPSVTPTPGAQP